MPDDFAVIEKEEKAGIRMTLLESDLKQLYRLNHMELDRDITRRLQMLGMTENAEVLVLNRKRDGSMIIKVRGTRFAIGQKYASGIYIGDVENVKGFEGR